MAPCFYQCDAMLPRYLCRHRPSGRLSQVGFLLRRLNLGSRKQHHTIAQRIFHFIALLLCTMHYYYARSNSMKCIAVWCNYDVISPLNNNIINSINQFFIDERVKTTTDIVKNKHKLGYNKTNTAIEYYRVFFPLCVGTKSIKKHKNYGSYSEK